jgi:hypothetical protein
MIDCSMAVDAFLMNILEGKNPQGNTNRCARVFLHRIQPLSGSFHSHTLNIHLCETRFAGADAVTNISTLIEITRRERHEFWLPICELDRLDKCRSTTDFETLVDKIRGVICA